MGAKQGNELLLYRVKHAIKRFRQRFGIFLSEYEYCKLVEKIIEGESNFICSFSNNYKLHKVQVGSEWIPVVYSKRHKIIITIYHNKWIKRKKNGKYHVISKAKNQKPPKKKRLRHFEKPHYALKNKWSKSKKRELGLS